MLGSAYILEIADPSTMMKTPPPPKNNVIRVVSIDEVESKSTKGTKVLADSLGVVAVASFPYKEQLYHVLTDLGKTYIAIIENGRFKTVQVLLDKPMYGKYRDSFVRKMGDKYYVRITINKKPGILMISENKPEINIFQ
jgi:hypothetical protein